MASTYSTNLAIELIGTGDQAGAWGNTTNTNLGTLIEQAISGYVTQAVSTGTDTTITIPNGATGVARNMYIELTGTGGTNTNLIVPANKKLYFIFNNTTGAVTVKVSGQTGVSVPQGKKMVLVSNGTDVVVAENYIADFGSNSATITNLTCTSLTLSNNPVLSGGTANGVLYLNGSKVATSGSVLVFDGSNLGVGVTPSTFSTGKAVQIGTTNGLTLFGFSNGAELGNNFYFNSGYKYTDNGKATRYTLGDGVHTWSIAASGTVNTAISFTQAMTLDSSGNLGIGTSSPLVPLHVVTTGTSTSAGGNAVATFRSGASGRAVTLQFSDGTVSTWVGQVSGSNISFGTSNVEAMRLDSSGNLGLGVTPSAWSGVGGVFELKGNAYIGSTTNSISLASNTYFNGSNWIYKSTAAANLYSIDTGQHKWFNAASGTAGNTISFTQAMTLDASGNLGVGTTSPYKTITVGTSDATAWITAGGSDVNLTLSSVGTNGSVVFRTGGTNSNPSTTTERARITSDGNLLVGTTTATNNLRLQQKISTVHAGSNTYTGMAATGYSGTTADARPVFDFNRSRGTTDGSMTKVESGDTLGSIIFRGADGTSFQDSAMISAQVDGATGASDIPGRLVFYTSADGAASPSERARITSGGLFKASVSGTYENAGRYHELRTNVTEEWVALFSNAASSNPQGVVVNYSGAAPNNTERQFVFCLDTGGLRAEIRSNGGIGNYQNNDVNLSDERVKKDIKPLGSMWDKFKALEIVTFKYKDQTHDDDNIGVIAQQVESVAPEFVDNDGWGKNDSEDGVPLKSVYTADMYHAAIKALQEAMARIESLEAKVAALEAK